MRVDEEARPLQVQVGLLTCHCAACIDNSWLTICPHRAFNKPALDASCLLMPRQMMS